VDIGADEFHVAPPTFVPVIIRVSPSGDDASDGLSWPRAKRTVQAAVDTATISGGEVWVQSGTYQERVALGPFVYLYGGFSGIETNRAQRDWKVNVTILDARQQGSVVTAQSLLNWNAVDGFVIRNGHAPAGGGIYCADSSPIIANNTITGSMATNTSFFSRPPGGGIYCYRASPLITNNVISFNQALIGGGIYCGSFSAPFIANNRIEGNVTTARRVHDSLSRLGGGGVYIDGIGNPTIANNFLLNNIATNQPDAVQAGFGGAIACQVSTVPRIIGNTFLGNRASSSLGPYYENGGGIYSESSRAVIVNNLLAFGSSGIHSSSPKAAGNIRNNCIYGNTTNYVRMEDLTGNNGNISADPLLAATDDFHLSAGSSCIDAGDDGVPQPGWLDLDGQGRKAGAHVDIGADEYGSSAPFSAGLFALQYAGETTLRLFGDSNLPCVIETSTDLNSWSPISTNAAERGFFDIPVARDASETARFYRAVTRR
jgi:hypothetical protein